MPPKARSGEGPGRRPRRARSPGCGPISSLSIELGPANGFSRGCLIGNFSAELSSQSADIRAALDEVLTDWTKDIAQVIAEAQKAGDVSRDIPATMLAAFLLNAWEGAVLRSRVEKNSAPLDVFMSVTFNKILT